MLLGFCMKDNQNAEEKNRHEDFSAKSGRQRLKKKQNDIQIELIPNDNDPNPRNPYYNLTQEKRYARIVKVLAQIYQRELNAVCSPKEDIDHG